MKGNAIFQESLESVDWTACVRVCTQVYMCMHRCVCRAHLPASCRLCLWSRHPSSPYKKWTREDFPGGPAVKNLPSRASLVIQW